MIKDQSISRILSAQTPLPPEIVSVCFDGATLMRLPQRPNEQHGEFKANIQSRPIHYAALPNSIVNWLIRVRWVA